MMDQYRHHKAYFARLCSGYAEMPDRPKTIESLSGAGWYVMASGYVFEATLIAGPFSEEDAKRVEKFMWTLTANAGFGVEFWDGVAP